jgi:cell wall-associated NlpC family hydrolase
VAVIRRFFGHSAGDRVQDGPSVGLPGFPYWSSCCWLDGRVPRGVRLARGCAREHRAVPGGTINASHLRRRLAVAGTAVALVSAATAVTVQPSLTRLPDDSAAAAAAVAQRAGVARPASRAGSHAGFVVFGPLAPRVPESVDASSAPRAHPVAQLHAVRVHAKARARPPARVARVRHVVRYAVRRTMRAHPRLARSAGGLAGRGAAAVVSYAYRHLGAPYVYGAAGDGGFDCSGLTMKAFARAGIRLPHKAAEQTGRAVSLRHARAGDLVKWGSYHVGVYVGDGYVIHAPKPGDHVKKARLWGNYRIVRVM